jgi:hypothetical protein
MSPIVSPIVFPIVFTNRVHHFVADAPTWAALIVAGNRVFVKGHDALTPGRIEGASGSGAGLGPGQSRIGRQLF